MSADFLYKLSYYLLPLLTAITLHEAAHAYMAYRFGDSTAKMLGRLSLNPIKHIDPIGTVLLPLVLVLSGVGFVFGWAKPVPVNTRNLRDYKKAMFWVAAAGPLSNLVMAVLWLWIGNIAAFGLMGDQVSAFLAQSAEVGVVINLGLMIFNLVPILPLDGGRMLHVFLPPKQSYEFSKIEPYGIWIVLGLSYVGILWVILSPILLFFYQLIHFLSFA